MSNKKKNVQLGTVFRKKNDDGSFTTYLKFKFDNFGVKAIKVQLNDDSVVDLDTDSICFLSCPYENVNWMLENGHIDSDKAEQRVANMEGANVSKSLELKL